jgi:uncharacterized protein (TIGR03435 family)
MLRRLLEDRFKLNARIKTRDLPVYALTVARSDGKLGNQLRQSGDACLPPAPPAGAPPPPPPPPGGLGPTSGQCPSILAPGAISGRRLTMGRLVETLSLSRIAQKSQRRTEIGPAPLPCRFRPRSLDVRYSFELDGRPFHAFNGAR